MPRQTPTTSAATADEVRRIVSSEHLVSDKCPELSELEFGLIIASHAFGRWMIRCMSAAGVKDMTETEILVLHHVNHRGREKKLADICFVLNIEDTHVVSYAQKKLANLGLVWYCVHNGLMNPALGWPISLALIAEMNPGDLRDLAQSDDVPPLVSAVARRILG